MAVANNLAAVKNGAGRVGKTINGIEDRWHLKVAVALNIRGAISKWRVGVTAMSHQRL